MTAEAKIPVASTDWRSIDIYLFSNGQQLSPPRKYHLHRDELTWWKPTLMNLARLHYGSLHSCIELYTLDGHKVDCPLELTNGNAYVAVEPPDTFIDSGYNNYIMKASRSWEKSQARKNINNGDTKPDNCNNDVPISNSDESKNDVTMKITNESATTEMMISPRVADARKTSMRLKKYSLNHFTPLVKITDNHNQQNSRNAADVRKTSNSVTISPKKRSMDNKKDYNTKVKPKLQNVQNIPINRRENKEPLIEKAISTPFKSKTPFSVPSKFKRIFSDYSKPSSKLELSKSINNDTNANVQAATIFRNTDSELPSKIVFLEGNFDINEKQIINDTKEKCDIILPIPEETKSDILKEPVVTNNFDECKSSSKTFFESMQHESNVAFSNKIIKESCMLINKGDSLKLKLVIEVEKEQNGTIYNDKLLKGSQSLINIIKQEKASQIHVDAEILAVNKVQSDLFYTMLDTKQIQKTGAYENSNVVLLKCDCCPLFNDDIDNPNAVVTQNAYRKYFVGIPTTKYTEQIRRCQCAYKDIKVYKTSNIGNKEEHTRSSSRKLQLKKAISDVSLKRSSNIEPEIIIMLTEPEIPETENNQIDLNNHIIETSNKTKIDNEHIKSQYFVIRNESEAENFDKEKYIITRRNTGIPARTTLDKSVQTEHSNILLQARRQDDGHYSFHLPSLHLLRYYKFD